MVFRVIGMLAAVCLTLMIGCSGTCDVPTPNIVTQPKSQTVEEGERVTFSVVLADKSQMGEFQWQKNGINFALIQGFNSDLVINPASPSDAGSYAVIVTYSISGECSAQRSSTSSPGILTVNPKPSPSIPHKEFSESIHVANQTHSPA